MRPKYKYLIELVRDKKSFSSFRMKYIYVLYSLRHRAVKIGISDNPRNRAKAIRIKLKSPLKLIAYKISFFGEEQEIIDKLKSFRLNNKNLPNYTEWYSVDHPEVRAVVNNIVLRQEPSRKD